MKRLDIPAVFHPIGSFVRTTSERLRNILPHKKGAAILMVGLLIISGIFFVLWRGAEKQLASPADLVRRQRSMLTTQVGKLMELPAGEEPTVATIMDATKLREQPFFAKAKNGDRLLWYSGERLVILYDPAANKIVNVGSVTTGSSPSASFTQPGIQKNE